MSEVEKLKTGDETRYSIEGKTVTLKPMTLGKMKRAMKALLKKDGDTFEVMVDSLVEILDNGKNPFATRDWIGDNVTMPMATKIMTDMRTINGLGDVGFFPKGAMKDGSAPLESRDLVEEVPTR